MSDLPTTFDALIGQWGIANFAAALGVSYSTANAMKQRNSVAAKYWPAMLKEAPADLELTPDALFAMQARSRAHADPAAPHADAAA